MTTIDLDKLFPVERNLKAERNLKLKRFYLKKYKAKIEKIATHRRKDNVKVIKKIIHAMVADGFSNSQIALLMGKHRATIHHHIHSE